MFKCIGAELVGWRESCITRKCYVQFGGEGKETGIRKGIPRLLLTLVDALRAVAVAFGVAGPSRDGSGMRAMAHVEAQHLGLRFLEAGEWR
jgi:hypothetical protein